MFIALYRWKVKEGKEQQCRDGWHRGTETIYRDRGSLGSRLHLADDNIWYGYAQWSDRESYFAAANIPVTDKEGVQMFHDSVEEQYPVVYLEVTDDLLKTEKFNP